MARKITEEQAQELFEHHARSWGWGLWIAIAGGIISSFFITPIGGLVVFVASMMMNTTDSLKQFNEDVKHQELLNK
jgi:hypothetical protein